MKLQCTADQRAWADVVDVWTRKMILDFLEILSREAPLYETLPKDDDEANARQATYVKFVEQKEADLSAYLHRVIKSAHIADAEGNEYDGVDAVLAADLDGVDAAVTSWWANLPRLAYRERQKLGEVTRVS